MILGSVLFAGSRSPRQADKAEEKENGKPAAVSSKEEEKKPDSSENKKKVTPSTEFSWRPTADREDSQAETPQEEPVKKQKTTLPGPVKKQKTILKKEQKPKAKKPEEPENTQEDTTPKHVQRTRTTTFVLPPRRERTRIKLQRALTQQQLRRSASNVNKPRSNEDSDKYTIEDAINIYASDFVHSKTKTNLDGQVESDKKQNGPEQEKTIYESPIDPMRTVPPWHRREYMLTKRETYKYKEIHRVYGHEDKRVKHREEQFFQKLEDIQIEKWRQKHREYYSKRVESTQRKNQQQRQLKRVRGKFEKEQVHRFRTQYVTSRILAHEWSDRYVYGLPEDIGDEPQTRSKLRPMVTKPKETFDTADQRERNERRYRALFSIHHSPYGNSGKARKVKPPRMEGIDTVELGDNNKGIVQV